MPWYIILPGTAGPTPLMFSLAGPRRGRAGTEGAWAAMTVSEPDQHGKEVYDRALLLGRKRDEVLALWEVQQYGQDSFGDPDYVSIYGLKPRDWYARGVRIAGRTAVECTRDRLAGLIGRDVAARARTAVAASSLVVDLFAGSGNTAYWIKRRVGASRAIGFELDGGVFELARGNLSIIGLGVDLRHQGYQDGLHALGEPPEDLVILFVAPPWGNALSKGSGLDLRLTRPPVAEVVDVITAMFGHRKLLFAVQLYETVEPASLAVLAARFAWSTVKVYDINAPGHNHGLFLATWGWA